MTGILATNEARSALNRIAAELEGGSTEPVFFGPHRRAVAVIISVETYTEMLDRIDDLTIANEVRIRLDRDNGDRVGFDELARSVNLDPAAFPTS